MWSFSQLFFLFLFLFFFFFLRGGGGWGGGWEGGWEGGGGVIFKDLKKKCIRSLNISPFS